MADIRRPTFRRERIRIGRELSIRIASDDRELTLRDISDGGFALIADRPFMPETLEHFTITTADGGVSVTLSARSRYCRSISDGQRMRFVSGWQFIGLLDDERSALFLILAIASNQEPA